MGDRDDAKDSEYERVFRIWEKALNKTSGGSPPAWGDPILQVPARFQLFIPD